MPEAINEPLRIKKNIYGVKHAIKQLKLNKPIIRSGCIGIYMRNKINPSN